MSLRKGLFGLAPSIIHLYNAINMKLKYSLLILISLILIALPMPTEAQEHYYRGILSAKEYLPEVYGQADEFKKIKAEVKVLIRENKELEALYALLTQEIKALKELIEKRKNDVSTIRTNARSYSKQVAEKKQYLQTSQVDLDTMKKDLLLERTKNIFLAGQLMDLDKNQRLWSLKLAELQYQKRELLAELKLREYKYNEMTRRRQAEILSIQNRFKQNVEREKELTRLLEESHTKVELAEKQIPSLREGNIKLEKRKIDLQKKKDFAARENEILNQKKKLALKSQEYLLIDKEKVKAGWEDMFKGLQSRYNALDRSVNTTMSLKSKKRDIMKKIIKIDKENLDLRRKKARLEEEIKSLK